MRTSAAVSLILMSAAGGRLAAESADLGDRPYPQGRRFPLGLYSVHTPEEMTAVKAVGYNMGHRYGFAADYLDLATQAGLYSLAHIRGRSEGHARREIEELAAYDCVSWWDLPEEQRHWRKREYRLVQNLCAWTRKHDPLRRPNFMYLPGHYGPDAVAKYVPYLDIIGAGAYTEYAHQPHAWVRWRVESEIAAIRKAGYKVGSDYLNGEKTPIGIPMLFGNLERMDVITPVEAYHDFYSCIASGARGILIFSYWHKRDLPVLERTWEAYEKAASEITGEERLGEIVLFGEEVRRVRARVLKGPRTTPAFSPYGYRRDIRYASINVLAKRWQGCLYVIAVNSAERSVDAVIEGLGGAEEAEVLFEDRTVPLRNGRLTDSFTWLGVHIYKVPGSLDCRPPSGGPPNLSRG
jgi:hypothetical protein